MNHIEGDQWKPRWEYVATIPLANGQLFRWGGMAMNDFEAVSNAIGEAFRQDLEIKLLGVANVVSFDDDGTERRYSVLLEHGMDHYLESRKPFDDSDD